jgi:xanthine dehydrogenase/oxidase
LGASVFFAIRDAIHYSRYYIDLMVSMEHNIEKGYFRLDSPATSERIRMSCVDKFSKSSHTPLGPDEKCWGVSP